MRAADRVAPLVVDPTPARSVRRQLVEHVRTPLHRDGYALVVNSAFTAATGLAYWLVAARFYSPHAVGLNSALISSMMFLSGVAGLNLANVVVRFLPGSGERTPRMIALSYAATGVAAALAAGIFLVGVDAWAPRLQFVAATPVLAAWFVLSTVGWCVFAIQDGVLTALGRALWVPAENAVFSVVKLGFLVVAASLMPLYGIFVSWTAAMLLSVVAVSALIFTRLARAPRPSPRASDADRAGFGRYFAADYVGAVAWLASINLLPVIVTGVAGATANGYFALAWAVAFPLYAVPTNIGWSLTLHGASDSASLRGHARKVALQGLLLLLPAVVVLVVGAPYLLSLFGESYANHGTTLLRLLALGALPNLVLALAVAVARVRRRLAVAVTALIAQAALNLGLAVPLLHALGVAGPGVAWLGSQCVVGAGLLAFVAFRRPDAPLRERRRAQAADLRRRAGEAASGAGIRRRRSLGLARRLLADHGLQGDGQILRTARTDSDVVVVLVGRGDPTLAVKVAWSDAADASLAAQRAAVYDLRRLPGLDGWTKLVPEEIAHGSIEGRSFLIERALSGVDGGSFVRSEAARRAAAAAARVMAPLYDATALSASVDAATMNHLVLDRLERVAAARGRGGREAAFDAIAAELEEGVRGRPAVFSWIHGDLWLGNVLLTPDASRVTGVVDWEASRASELPAVDLAHLVLATRSGAEGRELGVVTRRLLAGDDVLEPHERDLLAPYAGPEDGIGERHLVLMAWLQHVAARLAQGTLHARGRWMRRNIDPVLAFFER